MRSDTAHEFRRNIELAERDLLYRRANVLALITIFYNLLEGIVSISLGMSDETVALFGFGVDSFVEVISGIGIWHMIRRIRASGSEMPDRFEQRALRITGVAFYLLAAGLVMTAGVTIVSARAPESTVWGIVVSLVSILTMWLLIRAKMKVGTALRSDAIIADANCTRTCLLLSVILLASSAGFSLTGIGGLDAAGALGISWISFREGREAFEKAKGKVCGCCGPCGR